MKKKSRKELHELAIAIKDCGISFTDSLYDVDTYLSGTVDPNMQIEGCRAILTAFRNIFLEKDLFHSVMKNYLELIEIAEKDLGKGKHNCTNHIIIEDCLERRKIYMDEMMVELKEMRELFSTPFYNENLTKDTRGTH